MELTLQGALLLALENQRAGRLDMAASLYSQILRFNSDHPQALHLLGVVCLQRGQPEAAAEYAARAVAIDPANPVLHNALGEARRQMGHLDDALECFRLAGRLPPETWEPWSNLSLALLQLGRLDEAVEAARRALSVDPGQQQARHQLRAALLRLSDSGHAIRVLREQLDTDPTDPEDWRALGFLLGRASRPDLALEAQRRAVGVAFDNAGCHEALASIAGEHGFDDEAQQALERALALSPRDGLKFRLAMLLPTIVPDPESIVTIRDRFRSGVEALRGCLTLTDPVAEVGTTNFLLAYHGEDDRPLQELVAKTYLEACPQLGFTAPHCLGPRRPRNRIRIAFVSRFLHSHSIGKSSRGLIASLPRDRFHVSTVRVEAPRPEDKVAQWIDERSDDVITLPHGLAAARDRMAGAEFDVVFYQDIGMDPMTYHLSFARLAPVQCVTFGHPVTTGVPALDYYLSTEEFEPESAEAHYSESLVRLPTQISHYFRPPEPEPVAVTELGLDDGDTFYLCPQTLFKIHPSFDHVLRAILRRDPRGRLLLLASPFFGWGERLAARFGRTMPDVTRRVTFLPPLSETAFRSVVFSADVVLDTPHFGGYNTTLEAFAAGKPVVTWPGRFQRSQHTAAFYRRMGIPGLVASDAQSYEDIAIQLGTDSILRREVSRRILDRCGQLFEDSTVAPVYGAWFEAALRRHT